MAWPYDDLCSDEFIAVDEQQVEYVHPMKMQKGGEWRGIYAVKNTVTLCAIVVVHASYHEPRDIGACSMQNIKNTPTFCVCVFVSMWDVSAFIFVIPFFLPNIVLLPLEHALETIFFARANAIKRLPSMKHKGAFVRARDATTESAQTHDPTQNTKSRVSKEGRSNAT